MRVLVVDDEPAARLLVQAVVRTAGHECETADNGAQALDRLRSSQFDVLVTDAQMPGLSGFELATQVRREPGGYVYVVMLTGLGDDSERLAGMRAGVDDFLTKPLRPSLLTSELIAAERVVSLHPTIEDQRRALEEQASHDVLTGVFNRLRLDGDLDVLLARADRYGQQFCVALLDVDRFKAFNDSYGHLAGDATLRAVAGTLASVVRTEDGVYRYGGEEFVLLLPEQDLAGALVVVERLQRAVRELGIQHGGSEHGVVTISAGVAQSAPTSVASRAGLLEAADRALFAAKASGRDRVVAATAWPPALPLQRA
jgi:diguanylate cyclase (GGDEF)-like protein